MNRDNSVPLVRIETTTADDPECGVGLAVFVAGCPRHCPGCQNPGLRNVNGLQWIPVEWEVLRRLAFAMNVGRGLYDAIVFLGGEWMLYPKQYLRVVEWAKSTSELRTVLYTGETYECLPEDVRRVTDWVIDGEYDRRRLGVYPASTNQRVFHQGELTDPEGLPLFKHLSTQVRTGEE